MYFQDIHNEGAIQRIHHDGAFSRCPSRWCSFMVSVTTFHFQGKNLFRCIFRVKTYVGAFSGLFLKALYFHFEYTIVFCLCVLILIVSKITLRWYLNERLSHDDQVSHGNFQAFYKSADDVVDTSSGYLLNIEYVQFAFLARTDLNAPIFSATAQLVLVQ